MKKAKTWEAYKLIVSRKWTAKETRRIERPAEAAELFYEFAHGATQESLFVMVLGGRNDLLGIEQVYLGTATGTSVRIGELFRSCVAMGAQGVVVVHNHPSRDSQPSDEDIKLTGELVKAARLLDIEFLDHLVIGGDGFTSIRSQRSSLWESETSDFVAQLAEITATN